MIVDRLRVSTAAFHAGTGWEPKPEGLCRGEVCVPAPGAVDADGTIDVEAAAGRLGMPVVHDPDHGVITTPTPHQVRAHGDQGLPLGARVEGSTIKP